jgi:hypothetical protein
VRSAQHFVMSTGGLWRSVARRESAHRVS